LHMVWSTIWQPLSMWTEENLPQLGLIALIVAVIAIAGAGILHRIARGSAYQAPRGKSPRYKKKQLPRGVKGRKTKRKRR